MKIKEKFEARRLRKEEQLTITTIAEKLGVAKSTVSLWVRDLSLPPTTIRKYNMAGCIKAGKIRAKTARQIRSKYQQKGAQIAKKYQNNTLFVSGCMMHWSEGAKDKNIVSITNTDLHFIKLWVRFMQHFFDILPSDFRVKISCYLNNGLEQSQIEAYWRQNLLLPDDCFTKTTIIKKHPMSTGVKKNRHPYGVIRIVVCSTKIVQQIWGAIKFLADIDDKNKWLD